MNMPRVRLRMGVDLPLVIAFLVSIKHFATFSPILFASGILECRAATHRWSGDTAGNDHQHSPRHRTPLAVTPIEKLYL